LRKGTVETTVIALGPVVAQQQVFRRTESPGEVSDQRGGTGQVGLGEWDAVDGDAVVMQLDTLPGKADDALNDPAIGPRSGPADDYFAAAWPAPAQGEAVDPEMVTGSKSGAHTVTGYHDWSGEQHPKRNRKAIRFHDLSRLTSVRASGSPAMAVRDPIAGKGIVKR
jgi:hypothetical protein